MFWKKRKIVLQERDLSEIKMICNVLFIDDKKFPVVDILISTGWQNTKRIKDVQSLDEREVAEAHILFVDIQGVGRKLKFKDEGLGLLIALKEKYPNKRVVVYSAEDQGAIQAFHPGIDKADKRLSKHSDPYQFQAVVESYAKEAFSLTECINRIKKQVLDEFGYSLKTEKVLQKINTIYIEKDYSTDKISKVFNMQNSGNVASIIQLFLTSV